MKALPYKPPHEDHWHARKHFLISSWNKDHPLQETVLSYWVSRIGLFIYCKPNPLCFLYNKSRLRDLLTLSDLLPQNLIWYKGSTNPNPNLFSSLRLHHNPTRNKRKFPHQFQPWQCFPNPRLPRDHPWVSPPSLQSSCGLTCTQGSTQTLADCSACLFDLADQFFSSYRLPFGLRKLIRCCQSIYNSSLPSTTPLPLLALAEVKKIIVVLANGLLMLLPRPSPVLISLYCSTWTFSTVDYWHFTTGCLSIYFYLFTSPLSD